MRKAAGDVRHGRKGKDMKALQALSAATRGMGQRGAGLRGILSERSGQGTTEYAILVGVLVVIAIIAIISFRDKVSELWNAISEGINSL